MKQRLICSMVAMLRLEEVVEHYGKGGDKNKFIDTKIFPLQLTKQDLVAFMKALTSQTLPEGK